LRLLYCICCISYRICYRLFIGFFEETKKPGQIDKHDGEPQGIERTDRKGENRTRMHEGTDRTDSRAYGKRHDAAPTRTDINIRVGLSTLSICPCGTYGMDWMQRIEGQISAEDFSIGQTAAVGKD
jgi:hypothetical protein